MKQKLEKKAHVVATVTSEDDLQWLSKNEPAADLLELRIDNLWHCRDKAISQISEVGTPVLATVRRPDEGGHHDLADADRIEEYRRLLSCALLLDTEIASLQSPSFAPLLEEIKTSEAILVASAHDFQTFPGVECLKRKLDAAFELGADVGKVAVVTETMKQLFDLVSLVESYRSAGQLVSAMGMGPLGKLSRLVLAEAGSCLNYGYLQQSNAPGQWSAAELSRLLKAVKEAQ